MAAGARRTSCSRPSRRSRKSSACQEAGHDYFLQVTDARPDTGGLSGATATEAMTWGKVDPEKLPDSVTCYTDSTIALPLLTAYALARHAPRPLKRLYDAREGHLRRASRRLSREDRRSKVVLD